MRKLEAIVVGFAIALSALMVSVCAHATDTLYFSPSGKSGPAGTNVEMVVKLNTPREVAAIVVFVEHDGDTDFVSAVQGSAVSGWDIDVHEDIANYPGSAWILLIGDGVEYVTGNGQEVAKLTFTLGGCGTSSPITWVADDCTYTSYLSTTDLHTIFPSSLNTCGDLPWQTIQFGNGTVTATVPTCGCEGCMYDKPASTWSLVKSLFN